MRKFFYHLIWILKGIQVYALVGRSGTGKSFRAKLIAEKYGIPLIIDDGLLISKNRIIAGKTAKKEKGYLSAVKTALFEDKKHREEVIKALSEEKFKRVLIIGTSEKMAAKIAERLNLPKVAKMLRIEDFATRQEIERATNSRQHQGNHVIPVPSIQIERAYPQIFYDSVKVFLKNKLNLFSKNKVYEKSVVRPEFGKRGAIKISEPALAQMILHCVDEFDPGIQIKRLVTKQDTGGYRLRMVVEAPYGTQLSDNIYGLQDYVIEHIQRYTGIMISNFEIVIDEISDPQTPASKLKHIVNKFTPKLGKNVTE